MATILHLQQEGQEWQQVYFDGSQNFKLTRENPYFTQSESYTFDVTIPMDIPQNRTFFKSIQRIDRTKTQMLLKCRLLVDNRNVLDGTAKVTQVTQLAVKVQLLGGKSEINLLSSENKTYIDEMYLGEFVGWGIWLDYKAELWTPLDDGDVDLLPIYDETNGRFMNSQSYHAQTGKWSTLVSVQYPTQAQQPRLLYVVKAIVEMSGYTLERCDFDCEPWNRLFIASAKSTAHVAHALPHWLVKDFFDELCNFFNCTLIVNQEKKTVAFMSNKDFFGNATQVSIEPVTEYTTEMNEDSNTSALATDNIEYDMSPSEGHVYDILTEERRDGIPTRECESKSAAVELYESLSQDEKLCYVYSCPVGRFAGWKKGDGNAEFTQIDHFAPLVRDKQSDSSKSLKICPVALMETTEALIYGYPNPGAPGMTCVAASIENPTGAESFDQEEKATAQELIEGDVNVEDKAEKEDRLQVMFIDDRPQRTEVVEGDNKGDTATHPMPFTDCNYMAQAVTPHRSWSLSLNPTNATYYLGQLHQNGFTFNIKAKHTFKFLADQMPDPTHIFLIRGHRYACEKIEANVNADGFDRLMTGYFYEML